MLLNTALNWQFVICVKRARDGTASRKSGKMFYRNLPNIKILTWHILPQDFMIIWEKGSKYKEVWPCCFILFQVAPDSNSFVYRNLPITVVAILTSIKKMLGLTNQAFFFFRYSGVKKISQTCLLIYSWFLSFLLKQKWQNLPMYIYFVLWHVIVSIIFFFVSQILRLSKYHYLLIL